MRSFPDLLKPFLSVNEMCDLELARVQSLEGER